MNKAKLIFQTRGFAEQFLISINYTVNMTKHMGNSCECTCGETFSIIYAKEDNATDMIRVGICEVCGEESLV